MADNIEGSTGTADNAAYGKHIHQQNVSMQSDLTQALQDFRLELRLVRRDMDTLVTQMAVVPWRLWTALSILAIFLLIAVFFGDRQITTLRSDVRELQQQLQQQERQIQALQYQVQVLRQQAAP